MLRKVDLRGFFMSEMNEKYTNQVSTKKIQYILKVIFVIKQMQMKTRYIFLNSFSTYVEL